MDSQIHCYRCGKTSTVYELMNDTGGFEHYEAGWECACKCGLTIQGTDYNKVLDDYRTLQIVIFDGCKEPFA